MRLLADECCPRAVVDRLRADGHDVRYAAETDRRAEDADLLATARSEDRVIITEDFDFGDLLIRDGLAAPGVIVLFLPKSTPVERADRVATLLAAVSFDPLGALSIVDAKNVRQRRLP